MLSTDRLTQLLWGADAPPGGHHAIHSYVSTLRRLIAPSPILVNLRPGYRIEVGSDDLDVDKFRALLTSGALNFRQANYECASDELQRACDMWRDVSLPDFPISPSMQGAARQLSEELYMAEDLLADAYLSSGRSSETIPALFARTTERPGHEKAWGQLMLALYQSDRRAQALEIFTFARQVMLDEFGLEPGESIRRLHYMILNDDPPLNSAALFRSSAWRLSGKLY